MGRDGTRRPTHRPLVGVTLAYAAGILVGQVFYWPLRLYLMLFPVVWGGAFGLVVLPERARRVLVLGAWFCLGLARPAAEMVIPRPDLARVFGAMSPGERVMVEGRVVSDPEDRSGPFGRKRVFLLQARTVIVGGRAYPVRDRVYVQRFFGKSGNPGVLLRRGDEVRLRGKLHRPYRFSQDRGGSRRTAWRGARFVLSVAKKDPVWLRSSPGSLLGWMDAFRQKKARAIQAFFPSQEAGILRAMLLGDRAGLSKEVREVFIRTGTAHILAISGLHMGVVAGLLMLTTGLLPLSRRGRLLVVILVLMSYAVLVGGRPSVWRAVVMAEVFLISMLTERQTDPWNTLALAALAILLVDPTALFSVGFQLSFVCVGAIMLGGRASKPSWASGSWARTLAWLMMQGARVSGLAWLGSAPLMAWHFHEIHPVAILANVVLVPLVSVMVTVGMMFLFWPMDGGFIHEAIGACLSLLLVLLTRLAMFFASFPWSVTF